MFCLISSRNNQSAHEQQISALEKYFPEYEFADVAALRDGRAKSPLIIFPCSGGTESAVISLRFDLFEAPVFLYSVSTDNSSAAANEIAFWMRKNLIPHFVCRSVEELKALLPMYYKLQPHVHSIRNTKLLRIGGYSSWLVNESEFGGYYLPKYYNISIYGFLSNDFQFHECRLQERGAFKSEHLAPAYELYSRLKSILLRGGFAGLTVECFTLLQTQQGFAACLPYAVLYNEGFLAACEGEVSSLIGMVFLKQMLGKRGIFMCNFIEQSDGLVRFAHCTAPLCGLAECGCEAPYWLHTHYETGLGSCVTVQLYLGQVALFKMRPKEGLFQLEIGEVVSSPGIDDIEDSQCRTQVCVRVAEGRKIGGLGNHYLLCKFDGEKQIEALVELLGTFGLHRI